MAGARLQRLTQSCLKSSTSTSPAFILDCGCLSGSDRFLTLARSQAARSAGSFELIAASVTGLDFRPALHMRPRRAGTSGNPGRAKPEFGSRASELSTLWARNPDFWARNPDFLGPESRKSGSGFRERNPGPPARADRKPRLWGGAPSRKPGAKARPWRSEFRHRIRARVTLAPPVTSTAGPSYQSPRPALNPREPALLHGERRHRCRGLWWPRGCADHTGDRMAG